MKVCNRCKIEKQNSDFRLRTQKRKLSVYKYLNSTCRKCDAEISKERHQKLKHNEDYKEINRVRVKEWNRNNPEYAKERWQSNKYSLEWKARLHQWREKNKERVSELHKIRAKFYHDKNRDSVTDSYCISKIKAQFPSITNDFLLENPDIIELKRTEILIFRLNKQINKNGKK